MILSVMYDHGVREGRRARRRQETREALLDAARALFAEHGVPVTRVDEITERADLGKGAFYNYFPSKEALVAALVVEGVERLSQRYLGSRAPRTLLEGTRRVIGAHRRFFAEEPTYARLFHHARGLMETEQGAKPLQGAFSAYLDAVARALRPARATPRKREIQLAAVVVGAIAGYRSFTRAAAMEEDPALLLAVLSNGLPGAARPRA